MTTTTDERTVSRSSSRLPVALLVTGLVLAAVAVWRISADDPIEVPYDDPQSAGLLTLCSDGGAVTGGEVGDRPFADVVLGETALPSELDPTGAVATLFAYQPREGIVPSEFSGSSLTAASAFADPEQPAVRVTDGVWSVGDFVSAFPADWDGFVQLRLYLGTPTAGTLTDRPYDTADLRVEGGSWELVRGGDASCADAESALIP